MDKAHDRKADAAEPTMPSEAELLAVMEQSDREAAAGLAVPLAEVLAELDEAIARLETRRHARRALLMSRNHKLSKLSAKALSIQRLKAAWKPLKKMM